MQRGSGACMGNASDHACARGCIHGVGLGGERLAHPVDLRFDVGCAAGPPPESQQTALLLLKGVLDPSASLLPNWDARVPVCSWAGLSCNTVGQVTNMCAPPRHMHADTMPHLNSLLLK